MKGLSFLFMAFAASCVSLDDPMLSEQDGSGGKGAGGTHGSAAVGMTPPSGLSCTVEELAAGRKDFPAGVRSYGFNGLGGLVRATPVEATVVRRSPDSLVLQLSSGETGTFGWPGDVPFDLPPGETVRIAYVGSWQIVTSGNGSLAVMHSEGYGSPPRAKFPGNSIAMISAAQCYFGQEETDDCSSRAPPGQLRTIIVGPEPLEAGWAVAVGSGRSAAAGGWTIENHVGVYLPGLSDEDCVVDSWSTTLVTAHTTHVESAPF